MRMVILRVVAAAVLLAAAAEPAAAELKYVMRLEVVKAGMAANPVAISIGEALQQMLPDGPMETVYVIGQKGMRVESPKAGMGLPAGAVAIWTEKDGMVVLNPADKTYWRLDLNTITGAMTAAGVTMNATVSAPVKGETILGVPTDKRTFEMQMQLAMTQGMPEMRGQLAALLQDMKVEGEIWTAAGRYQQYAPVFSKSAFARAMETFGLGEFTRQVVMRQTMRGGGYELRSEIISIAEEPVPASMFQIPADFREVPPPRR